MKIIDMLRAIGLLKKQSVQGAAVSSRIAPVLAERRMMQSIGKVNAGYVPFTVHYTPKSVSASRRRPGNHTANNVPTCTARQARVFEGWALRSRRSSRA